ncbi:MAG TPA: SDR family NAD(P)-dependent oxidoreductase [Acidimicrobiales bacterium]
MTRLDGHVSVVTGGNRGIGLGLAEGLVQAGATVAVWARDDGRTAEACAHLDALGAGSGPGGGRAIGVRCDVSDEHQVAAAMRETLADLGKVDSLFANAGVGGAAPFVDMTLAEWRRVMAVNLDGAFLTLREAARHLVERGEGGSLVAVSSVSAIHGAPRMEHYAASKTAVLALVRGLAVELARHRIRCNAVMPGWTDTALIEPGKANQRWIDATVGRTPVRRWGVPTDFRAVAAYLADPALSFHTGDSLVVDGGYSIF